ncbi:RloB family protein [Orrella daihaiensis]|uniref:RloB domain-containing protein n=1 Tax=Orrella daihaiensis TaxID=2782176 RepID=A0ABY4AJF1_9BURK|nr:RloB family protein [Orrella daihaiensis]UOD50413.1 RloB domain-containing protein [Orrella daihaiensis]
MTTSRRKFQRPLGVRRYKKLFVIATEGTKTEPIYFRMFNDDALIVRINCLKGNVGSAPLKVLKRMTDHLQRENLRPSDQAWLVVDKDQWTEDQLGKLHQWSLKQRNYGFALSNPKFEYWLLLHFEEGIGVASSRDCTERLKRWLPDYDKGLDTRKTGRPQINAAIKRAKIRDHQTCEDWPRSFGQTTVYRLVENILNTHVEQAA